MIKKYRKIWLLLLFFTPSLMFCFGFPESPFFSYRPNYGFRLLSDLSNSIQVETAIQLTEDFSKSGIFYQIWNLSLNIEGKELKYRIKFRIDSGGDFFIEELDDGLFLQTEFPDEPVLFLNPVLDRPFKADDIFSFVLKRKIPKLKVRDQLYRNVFEGVLKIGSEKILLYFAKGAGLIGVKTKTETFKQIF